MSSGINDLEVTARALSPAPGLPVSSFTVPTQGNIPLEHTQYFAPGFESSGSSNYVYSRPSNTDSGGLRTVREVVSLYFGVSMFNVVFHRAQVGLPQTWAGRDEARVAVTSFVTSFVVSFNVIMPNSQSKL